MCQTYFAFGQRCLNKVQNGEKKALKESNTDEVSTLKEKLKGSVDDVVSSLGDYEGKPNLSSSPSSLQNEIQSLRTELVMEKEKTEELMKWKKKVKQTIPLLDSSKDLSNDEATIDSKLLLRTTGTPSLIQSGLSSVVSAIPGGIPSGGRLFQMKEELKDEYKKYRKYEQQHGDVDTPESSFSSVQSLPPEEESSSDEEESKKVNSTETVTMSSSPSKDKQKTLSTNKQTVPPKNFVDTQTLPENTKSSLP